MYKLFLDDFRIPKDCYYMPNFKEYFYEDWVIARNYEDFCKIIEARWVKGEWPEVISFDHDLGDAHYGVPVTDETYDEVYSGMEEKTGLDCAKWLANFCLEVGNNLPERIRVHSANPVGAKNIVAFLENFRKFQESNKI